MVLLDTHAFVWLVSDQTKLSKAARKVLAGALQSAAISIVTAWEIGLLCKRGRLQLPLSPADYISRALHQHNIQELPLDRELIFRAVALPDLHNDPFDRILVATAQVFRMPLISKDRMLAQYPDVEVIW
ncbi:MAG: type II toxin-antitoxin system VapC family toxin [Oceanipulchritudo sp.]